MGNRRRRLPQNIIDRPFAATDIKRRGVTGTTGGGFALHSAVIGFSQPGQLQNYNGITLFQTGNDQFLSYLKITPTRNFFKDSKAARKCRKDERQNQERKTYDLRII